MLFATTIASVPLKAIIVIAAATGLRLRSFSIANTVATVVAAFTPINAAGLPATCFITGFASCAPRLSDVIVVTTSAA